MLSINKESFFYDYKKLDKRFNLSWDRTYEKLVNFSQTSDIPIHNWFYYQEGFSPILVTRILSKLGMNKPGMVVFDPFAGSGTTLLTAKKSGMKSYGFELNPFSEYMIRAKTTNYSKEELDKVKKFKVPKFSKIKRVYDKYELSIIKNLFDEEKLIKIELLKKKISLVKNEKVKMLLYADLWSILAQVSNYRKGGNGLKRKRVMKDYDPFVEFNLKKNKMSDDLQNKNGFEPHIINDSCLNMDHYKLPKFNLSFFSPPYANCFDPFEVYKIELWVGEFVKSYDELRVKRKTALTSNLNANIHKQIDKSHRTELLDKIIDYLSSKRLWDMRIVSMLDIYFNEMKNVLEMIFSKTKKGGFCVVVVGNSAYGNLSIPTDLLLAELGQKIGFKIKQIIAARNNETSSQQHSNLDKYSEYLRESIVIMKK